MYCTLCGASIPEGTSLCAHCRVNLAGRRAAPAPAQDGQWEYRDLTVPLGFIRRLSDSPGRHAEQVRSYDHLLLEHLLRAGSDGWQPDGPTDWASMLAAGRLNWRTDIGFPGPNPNPTTVYQSVTIRLKRKSEG